MTEIESEEPAPEDLAESPEEREAREDELLAEEPDAGIGLPRDEAGDIQTGHPAVDEVLRSLGVLDGAPVDEHVAVFEQAHEQLRRTLSGAGDEQD
jgi:hypothetical protein